MAKLDEGTVPALYHHCVRMYREMMNKAALVTLDGNVEGVVYEGFLTHLVEELNLSKPYFTKCRSALIQMGCIEQLRRGGSSTPSQWLLIKEPLLANFDPGTTVSSPPVTLDQYKAQQQQINSLNRRIGVLEQMLGISK